MNDDLERAIDSVGRDKVFRRAREIGWTDNAPPEWVKEDMANYEAALAQSKEVLSALG